MILIACVAYSFPVFGQAGLDRQVIGLAGNTLHSSSGASLDFTVGEVVASEIHHNTASLSQGFQQILVEKTTLTASTLHTKTAEVQVYPNPASSFIQIDTDTPLSATLFDLSGRPVVQEAGIYPSAQLSVHALPTGTYILRMISLDGQPVQNQKIQIVR